MVQLSLINDSYCINMLPDRKHQHIIKLTSYLMFSFLPSVSECLETQELHLFHKGDQILALNDMLTNTLDEIQTYLKRLSKDEVRWWSTVNKCFMTDCIYKPINNVTEITCRWSSLFGDFQDPSLWAMNPARHERKSPLNRIIALNFKKYYACLV